MESRRQSIHNHRKYSLRKTRKLWIERIKSILVACFFLGLIISIIFLFLQ